MRSRESAGDLRCDVERFAELKRLLLALTQRLAVNELRRDEMTRSGFVNLVNRNDVRMVQRRCGLSFLHKALHSIRVSRNVSRQNFQRNFAIELRILR